MNKIINIITTVIFVSLIAVISVSFWIARDVSFSDEESRSLTSFPKLSAEHLVSGDFSADMQEYYMDQFPQRGLFTGINSAVQMLVFGENNGILLGERGQLAVRLFQMYQSRRERTPDMDYYYEDNVRISLEGLNAFAQAQSRPLATILPPRTVDVAASAFSYPTEISDALWSLIGQTLTPETGYIDMLPVFREKYENGDYVYMRTDHHWTTYGAYLAYAKLMQTWDMEDKILPIDAFSVESIPNFFGTSYSKARLKQVTPDTLELWTLGNDTEFTTTCYASKQSKDEQGNTVITKEPYLSFPSWLNREYLDQRNKYAAFLDSTHNEQTVFKSTPSEAQRERLLIAKDSFANTMVPFLAQHFDLVIINLAGGITSLTSYAEEYDCDRILIVYNYANLIENNHLASVK